MKKTLSFVLVAIFILASTGISYAAEPVNPYDVSDIQEHWAFNSIAELLDAGIFSGYPDNTFRPDNSVSRAEYVTALFKTVCLLEDGEIVYNPDLGEWEKRLPIIEQFEAKDFEAPYEDLENHWSRDNVAWVKQYVDSNNPGSFEEIFPGNKFNPNKPITREEAAVLSNNFIQPPVLDKNLKFNDVPSGYKYYDEIYSLVNNGVLNGYLDGTFRPEAPITRAASAIILGKVKNDINQRADFFEANDYFVTPWSTADQDYRPYFLSSTKLEEISYQTQSELDKKYLALFNSINFEQYYYEVENGIYSELDADGYEYGTPEYEEELVKRLAELNQQMDDEKQEIGYMTMDEREQFVKDLDGSGYWNKPGVYYLLQLYYPEEYDSVDYLLKAENAYDVSVNGVDDLFYVYWNLLFEYADEGNQEKVVEYINKAKNLYIENNTYQLGPVSMDRFYMFAAAFLNDVEEYELALNYVDRLLEIETGLEDYLYLEKAALMYKTGVNKDEVADFLLEKMNQLKVSQAGLYPDMEYKYVWVLKTLAR